MGYISRIKDMVGLTTDRTDPDLGHGADEERVSQNKKYLVLSDDERSKGFVRPLRRGYLHANELGGCGKVTTMNLAIAETYARDPHFYGATYCAYCEKHRPVGENGEFYWVEDGFGETNEKVGT